MNIQFETLATEHREQAMSIYNYYVENSTAAFPPQPQPLQFFDRFLAIGEHHPAYAVLNTTANTVIGFCLLSSYSHHLSFQNTACLTYFISHEYIKCGVGSQCLEKLESDAKRMGITNLIADISSENETSIAFHEKHGFIKVGELVDIGHKLNRDFGVILMQKKI